MRGGVNYPALNAKVAAMRAAGGGLRSAANTASEDDMISYQNLRAVVNWLPFGGVRDFVADWAALPSVARDVKDYLRLWAKLGRLDTPNRRAMKPLLGTEIDLRNLVWLYRLKRFHGVSGDAVFGRLVPVRWRLGEAETRRLADATDEALLAEVKRGRYGGVFTDFSRPERAVAAALSRMYGRAAVAHPATVAGICGWVGEYTW